MSNWTVFRVPFTYNPGLVNPCTYLHRLPSKNCPKPGVIPQLTLYILRCLTVNPTIIASKAPYGYDGYRMNGSAMWKIAHWEADLTPPIFTLTSFRSARFQFHGPGLTEQFFYVYKLFHSTSSLQIEDLLIYPRGIWMVIGFCVAASSLTSYVLSGRFPVAAGMQLQLNKVKLRLQLSWGFWLGLFLSALGSYIIIIFVKNPAQLAPIRDFHSLASHVNSGKFKVLFDTDVSQEAFYEHANGLLNTSFRVNPPEVVYDSSIAVEQVLNDAPHSNPKHVYIVNSLFLPQLLHSYCGLNVVPDPSLPTSFTGIYTRPNFPVPKIGERHRWLINREMNRLIVDYFPRKTCPPNYHPFPSQISLTRTEGVFYALLWNFALAAVVLILEMVYAYLAKLFH